ncbi:LLM class flavin-dependent oxidoreductase [Pseudofrankia asymbiotica]|uniref:Monooxygenase n=1 Tax=Pseudofrankia asymbiotica TaxID=1834516 RepID=A0A1V2I7I4_9ACTN|nr:LLM class flavin-dependent oxidoreductase [Pseudofrankia asymbiotica]ONH28000.1 monooxygenase [Pseudofrankia asymbiotica]
MRVSLFVELPVPRPWSDTSDRDVFHGTLDALELADKVGLSGLWITEHHFQEEYSHASAPEVFLGAVSQRTTNLRLGFGIMHLPPAINHPARSAERVATLDVLSNGRVEFGTGEASSMAELGGFVMDPGRKREMWLEGLTVALGCLSESPFPGYEGTHVSMPARNIVPKPVQRPHPPVWVACTRPATTELAARMGIGALSFSYTGPSAVKPLIDNYYSIFAAEARPLTRAVNPNMLITAGDLMVARSHEEAVDRIGLGIGFHGYGIRHYYVSGRHHPGKTAVWEDYLRSLSGEQTGDARLEAEAAADAKRADWQALALANAKKTSDAHGGVGTPDEVREQLRRYEESGLDELMFLLPPARHEDIMESLELLGKEVLPEFVEREQAGAAAKARQREPLVEAALARHERVLGDVDPDYWFGGVPKAWTGDGRASEVEDAVKAALAAREGS